MNKNDTKSNNLTRLVAIALGLPWIEILSEVWKLGRKILRGLTNEGMYEVLDYESTLEIHDKEGNKATLNKRNTVRFLQDNIIAFQDYAWGDGRYLVNYSVNPGKPVDRYRIDNKTYILLSLREVRNKGDIEEFNIRWQIKKGFLKKDGWWTTEIDKRFKCVKVNVIFPKDRPPQKVVLLEKNTNRIQRLDRNIKKLPDGRWKVTWESKNPRLYERYIIKWEW